MELYQPIKITTSGIVSDAMGVGILTKYGAYVTGSVPRMSNVAVNGYIPKNTIFKSKMNIEHVLHTPPDKVVGKQELMFKPKKIASFGFAITPPQPSKLTMNIAKSVPVNFDVIIEETERGVFNAVIRLPDGKFLQPFNGWIWRNVD